MDYKKAYEDLWVYCKNLEVTERKLIEERDSYRKDYIQLKKHFDQADYLIREYHHQDLKRWWEEYMEKENG